MTKFIFREVVPCYVTFTYEIEAEDREAADDRFYNSPPDPVAHRVGDQLSSLGTELFVYDDDEGDCPDY